ncbi:DUF4767 domain-containing protein [Xylocopilactobacillus apis]|uniref:DUF4767 domain-containing protein n=1 Tax=Xylocopilactobacillus apis TaxID=2932183 RepID=A0AAU9CVZ5_9LACO|nr:DUF4767 domain-containing protein [Xylocopilactobacillus apis]BDR56586.1 DUF4767 domain-containing protein [Xylocopilactobacillus apis]
MKKTCYAFTTILILLCTMLVTGCSHKSESSEEVKSSSSSHIQKSKKKPIKVSESSKSEETSSNSEFTSSVSWTKDKNKELSEFMHSWQKEMGQSYLGTYDGQNPNHYGFIFPEGLSSGQLKGKTNWGEKPIEFEWSPDGNSKAEYQVVAVATAKVQMQRCITYFFTIHKDHPIVFVTQTTNGDTLYFYDSQNVNLQAGFAKIVTGKEPKYPTNDVLYKDMKRKIKVPLIQQQIPTAFKHVWYTYNSENKIDQYELTDSSKIIMQFYNDHGFKWINVRNRGQSNGSGSGITLRYHLFDGKMIPVAMFAYGGFPVFTGNGYMNRDQADTLKRYKFGDEIPEH